METGIKGSHRMNKAERRGGNMVRVVGKGVLSGLDRIYEGFDISSKWPKGLSMFCAFGNVKAMS